MHHDFRAADQNFGLIGKKCWGEVLCVAAFEKQCDGAEIYVPSGEFRWCWGVGTLWLIDSDFNVDTGLGP